MVAKQEKVTVKNQTAAKIGLMTSISLIICAIVGVGIFFKNGSVFKNNNGNAVGVFVSWIITAIIALFTAISFAEIVTVKKCAGTNAGLGGYAGAFVGYNFGRAVKLWMPTFYYSLKTVSMSVFAAAGIVYCAYSLQENPRMDWFGTASNLTMLFITLIAIAIVIIFMTTNYLSSRFGPKVGQISTILKFLPILIIVVFGVAFGIKNGGGLWTGDYSHVNVQDTNKGQFNFLGMLNSIPAIMFAFDGFLIIGNISNRVKDPDKNVGLSIILSMIIVAIINILTTVACITIGTGDPYEVFDISLNPFGNNVANVFKSIFIVLTAILIALSAIGTVNSYSMVGPATCKDGIDNEMLMFGKQLKKVKNGNTQLSGTIYYGIIVFFFFLIFGIPSSVINTMQIYDGVSTICVLIFFAIYGIVIFGGFANRKTKKNEVKKNKLFIVAAPVAMLGCFFTFGYSIGWTYTANMFTSGLDNTFTIWGLAFTPEKLPQLKNFEAMIIFWFIILFFIAYPFINDGILKATNKEYKGALMWQKATGFEEIIELKNNK